MIQRTFWLVAVASILLTACGSGPSTGEWSGVVMDSAGISIVRNPSHGIWRPGDSPWVTEVLRIGQAEGEPEYQFGEITGVSIDSDGLIYIGDTQARHVRVFGESGEYLRTIGRPGSGPGELGPGGTSVFFGRGDTIFIPDPTQQRVNLYHRDGTFIRSFPIPMDQGLSMRWAITPEYELLQHVRKIPRPGIAMEEGPDLILRRGSDGAIRDTVMSFATGESVRFRGIAPQMRFFAPEPGWAQADDGRIFFAVNSDYRIEVRSPDGSLRGLIERPFEAEPVTETDREIILDFLGKLYERQGIPPAAQQMVMQGITFEDRYPAFLTMMAGPEGSLWAQQVLTAEHAAKDEEFSLENMGAPTWDVFDREGQYLGVITLPARFQPRHFHGNRIYGVLKDELDVPYVVVLEIVGGFGEAD